jgi:hypothetical protein
MMGSFAGRGVLAAVLVLGSLSPGAATTHALFASGTRATDGVALGLLERPVAARGDRVAFRGTTSALLVRDGSGLAVLARTGDPAPSVSGTFNDFQTPSINDGGAVAFAATLNSPEAARGIFVATGAAIVPVVLSMSAGAGAGPATPEINAAGDVAYRVGTSIIQLYQHSTGASVQLVRARDVAPGGGTFRRFRGHGVLSDGGTIVFPGELRDSGSGIYALVPGVGGFVGVALALEGGANPGGGTFAAFGRQAVAVDPSGQAAAITADLADGSAAVLRVTVATGALETIAQAGTVVGTERLKDVATEYVGIDAAGNVAFEGVFDVGRKLVLASGGTLRVVTGNIGSDATEFAPRLTAAGRIVWTKGGVVQRYDGAVTSLIGPADATPIGAGVTGGDPSINDADAVAFTASRAGVYELTSDGAAPIVRAGDAIAGTAGIGSLGTHVFTGSTLAFVARDVNGRRLIATAGSGGLAKLVANGERTPIGGTFDLRDDLLAAQDPLVFFGADVNNGTSTSGLFQARVGAGAPGALVKAGDAEPNGAHFVSFEGLEPLGRQAVFAATLDSGAHGIFRTRRRGLVAVAVTGQRAPGTTGAFATFGGLVTSGARALFSATLSGGGPTSALFLLERGQLRLLAHQGVQPRAGGTGEALSVFEFGALALSGRNAVTQSSLTADGSTEGLLVSRRGKLRPIVRQGDPSPLGGKIGGLVGDAPVSIAGRTAVFAAALTDGAPVVQALFAETGR